MASSDITMPVSEQKSFINHKSLSSCVGGVSGKDDIADVWREHFDKLFNCIQDDDVNTRMINAEYSADIIVTSDDVAMAIRKISTGKSSGLDGIYAYLPT